MGYYVHDGISHCMPLKCPLKDSSDKGTFHEGSPPTGQGSKCNICCEGHTEF